MSYNFEIQGGKSYNIPVGGKYCPDNIVITATGGGVSLDVMVASSLPTAVVENQIVVITDTPAGTIYVDTDEPANPVNGDVWVQVGSSDYGVEFSETFRNGYNKAQQYNGSSWGILDGYIGISGMWEKFSTGMPVKGTPLSAWTWEQIIILANSGEDCSTWFAVGDEKDLVLTTGEIVPVVIGSFKHNPIYGWDGNAQIAFTTKNCLNNTQAMNNPATSAGGWDGSSMRSTHMANILATFPAELKVADAIKTVAVVATAGAGSKELVTSYDKLRLHSITELGLSYNYAGVEGTAYPYYASGNRVKTVSGTASYYWTRSPFTSGSTNFNTINTSGAVGDRTNAANAHGVAFAFDI